MTIGFKKIGMNILQVLKQSMVLIGQLLFLSFSVGSQIVANLPMALKLILCVMSLLLSEFNYHSFVRTFNGEVWGECQEILLYPRIELVNITSGEVKVITPGRGNSPGNIAGHNIVKLSNHIGNLGSIPVPPHNYEFHSYDSSGQLPGVMHEITEMGLTWTIPKSLFSFGSYNVEISYLLMFQTFEGETDCISGEFCSYWEGQNGYNSYNIFEQDIWYGNGNLIFYTYEEEASYGPFSFPKYGYDFEIENAMSACFPNGFSVSIWGERYGDFVDFNSEYFDIKWSNGSSFFIPKLSLWSAQG